MTAYFLEHHQIVYRKSLNMLFNDNNIIINNLNYITGHFYN